MIALTRILVPTNLGEPSRSALAYGVALARRFQATLSVLRVLSQREFDQVVEAERVVEALTEDDAAHTHPTVDDIVETAARASLAGLLDPQAAAAVQARYLLRPTAPHGPHEAIVACARDRGIDLIIMGRHRVGRVDQLLAGSVTERVVRNAHCPVLVVHHPEHEFVLPDV
jgi:nucleotide-binding universal stress UspA family protein